MNRKIPYGKQSINKTDVAAVCRVLESDWLTQGPAVAAFESALCNTTGAKHCVAVANGTVALHLACLAAGIGVGDTGVTSPISFLASANCLIYCGARPDFVDIDADTLCLSPDKLAVYCEQKKPPEVVIPVDFAGVPADLPSFQRLSRQYGFTIIEDAAHAIGSTYEFGGIRYACGSCSHSDLAIFSFHPVKTITSGEGGAILTNDDALAERLRCLADHGIQRDTESYDAPLSKEAWYHEMQMLGFNARLTDIHSALGLSQLSNLVDFKKRRQQIVGTYNEAFAPLEEAGWIKRPPWPATSDPCFHLYPLQITSAAPIDRDSLFARLRKDNVFCQIHYIPIYRQPYYTKHFPQDPKMFSAAETYFSGAISLPLFPTLTSEKQEFVISEIRSLLA